MINAANASAASGVDASSSLSKETSAEAGLFAKELNSRFQDLKTREDRINAALQTLKTMFPSTSVKTDYVQRDPGAKSKQFDTVSSDREVVINADVLENMTTDEKLAEQIQKLFEGFASGGWDKNLLDSRQFEGQVWKSMNIQAEMVGYYESYQTPDGTTSVAITNLRMQFDYRVSQNLDMLLGTKTSATSSTTNGLLGTNNQSRQSMFGSSWEFSAFFSSMSSQFFNFGDSSGGDLSTLPSGSLTAISVQLEMQMLSIGQGSSFSALMGMFGLVDPLVLDLGGEGIELRSAEEGVYFDMHGDGAKSRTGFVAGNSALLFLDANDNGVADDINELFGDSQGHANGFEKLRRFDVNGDGVIDENDPVYADLRLWRDLNGDGVNQEDETMSLEEAGIASLNLNYNTKYTPDGKGNVIAERSTFLRADGTTGTMADVWFKTLDR